MLVHTLWNIYNYIFTYIYIPLHLKCSTSIFGFRLRKSFLITGFFSISNPGSSDITLFSCKWDSRATSQFLVPATAFSFWWQPCKPQQRYSYHLQYHTMICTYTCLTVLMHPPREFSVFRCHRLKHEAKCTPQLPWRVAHEPQSRPLALWNRKTVKPLSRIGLLLCVVMSRMVTMWFVDIFVRSAPKLHLGELPSNSLEQQYFFYFSFLFKLKLLQYLLKQKMQEETLQKVQG